MKMNAAISNLLSALMILSACSKNSNVGADFDVSVEASCIDLSGSNFPSPFFTLKVVNGEMAAGTSFEVTFTKRLRAEYIRTWNGSNSIAVRSVADDERSAFFETHSALGAGGELVVYLDQMMTRGDVARVSLNGRDGNNGNNSGTLRVVQATTGSANVCEVE